MGGRLENKVALITGAASGIGLATAAWFLREGAAVVMADNQAEAVALAAERLGGRAAAVVMDVTRSADCRRAVETAVDRFGRR